MKSCYLPLISKITVILWVALTFCGLSHILVNNIGLGHDSQIRQLFDLGYEKNIPTWVMSQLWVTTGLAAFFCAWCDRRERPISAVWSLVGILFVFASVDDVAEIHENLGVELRAYIMNQNLALAPWHGSPGSPWLGFYVPVLIMLLAALIYFLCQRLAQSGLSSLRLYVVLAMLCFGAALSMDYFQGMRDLERIQIALAMHVPTRTLVYWSIFAEELLEGAGAILLAQTFLRYAAVRCPDGRRERIT